MPTIIHTDSTGSTNTMARRLWPSPGQCRGICVAVADHQQAGRGQQGSAWESAAGQNLLLTIAQSHEALAASAAFTISQTAAVAVCQTLRQLVRITATEADTEGLCIKWPNDIYWRDSKLCGILIETNIMGSQVAMSYTGIGINVNQCAFSPTLPNPVSLAMITGTIHDRDELLRQLLDRYSQLMESHDPDRLRQAYASLLYRRAGYHAYQDANGDFEAEIAGVEPDGHLLLRRRDGQVNSYWFKEVRYRLPLLTCE